ncbi:hypothetical protein TIFTF001_003968 [Ficus carica]|uniref:Uncharacterized protein n=1 Tax=Ficus carica TaxID=3494 RepID=A0AA88CSH8_FICCA|nr:hypothetical protein TIFTF001_003968 [Ficus carica]
MTIEVFWSINIRDRTKNHGAMKEISWRRSSEVIPVQAAIFSSSKPPTSKWLDSVPFRLNLHHWRLDPQRTPCEE